MNVLDEAAKHNPDAWWWLKADGCDINKGLKETAKLEWSGDVDLTDGSLIVKYTNYRKFLEMAENFGLCDGNIVQELDDVAANINEDLELLQAGMYLGDMQYCNLLRFF